MMTPCLYCLGLDGPPSVEHVAPAALGRHSDIKLPLGAVCEPCNNWTGRQIDEPLTQLVETLFIRGLHRVTDDRGRRVERIVLKDETGEINFPPDQLFEFKIGVQSRDEIPELSVGDTFVQDFVLKRGKAAAQRRAVARSLMKTGLCLVYLGHGAEFALNADLHATRKAILGAPHDGFLLTAPPGDPHEDPNLRVRIRTDVPGVTAAASLEFGSFHTLTGLHPSKLQPETRSWAGDAGWSIAEFLPKAVPFNPSQALARLTANL